MKLRNDVIEIQVDPKGAELNSLIDINTETEYMYQKTQGWWQGVSPVLFPYIGVTQNSQIKIDGKVYPTSKHGFLRDKEFVSQQEDESLVFTYQSTEDDYASYPYRFTLKIIYTLIGKSVHVQYQLENKEDHMMYYALGGHPAFHFESGDTVVYKGSDLLTRFTLDGPFINDKYEERVESYVLSQDLFKDDALIHQGVNEVTLKSKTRELTVDVSEFAYVGLWSMVKNGEMGPFVCVEPWQGVPDEVGFVGDISEKLGIQSLSSKGKTVLNFSIKIK